MLAAPLEVHETNWKCLHFSASGFPQSSSEVLPLLSGTGCSVYLLTSNTESCDEDDGEISENVVEKELADIPGTTHGTWLDFFAINSLANVEEMWLLAAFPVIRVPVFIAEFLQ